ncbi:Branched-chain amino acid ABC transporter amino acid-binding protein [Paramagnetospirillum magnetotacticum MS-1]|uniref:Branched-chain amino acid ABC transporter amino acid-binding protein n=1 Tax=Paramagnetospirillum magnetotacticum MS-1 TaxID=272627 RepID=A0A0C2YV83_PARME|nr:ABC transporter substrate-binding protein [Paramagnetospirillum magnetotacticum]KIL99038.1 Branched-chain amino acid ABC transporter amino acid-binding protein [Paramagnetospirillum magnetotacticum MS-1]
MSKSKLCVSALALSLMLGFAPAHAAEFKIGAEIPLSGNLARVGTAMNEGIQVAAEMFNKKSGKHSVKIITMDDESSPAKAVGAVEKLAADGVVAYTGGYGSNIIGPASEAAEKLGKVYVTSGGVASELTKRNLKTFFRINSSEGYARALMGMFNKQGVKSVAVVYSTKEATEEVAKMLQSGLGPQGVKVTMHAFDPATNDFKPIIHKIKLQDRPDAIAMIGYENDYVGILRAAKVLKPDIKTIAGVWSLATAKMAAEFPDLMENVSGTSTLSYPAEFTTPEAKEFAETYQKMFNKAPDYLGIFGYVQSKLLFEAVARAADTGTVDKGGIATEMRKTLSDTVIGKVRFDESGDNPEFTHRMGQHQAGKVVLVWPSDAATGTMKYPAVPW